VVRARVFRDRRGVDTVLLTASRKVDGRPVTHVIYAFRTPSGLSLGREVFDADTIHLLEARYPDLEFDWARLNRTLASGAQPSPGESRGPREGSPDAAPDRARAARAERRQPVPPEDHGASEDDERPAPTLGVLREQHRLLVQHIYQRVQSVADRELLLAEAATFEPDRLASAGVAPVQVAAEVAGGVRRLESRLPGARPTVPAPGKRRRSRRRRRGGGSSTGGEGTPTPGSPGEVDD
jgi:hypothetical protein